MKLFSDDWSVLVAAILVLTLLSYFAATYIRRRNPTPMPSRAELLREQIAAAQAQDFEAVLQRVRIKHEIESLRAQLVVLETYGASVDSTSNALEAA